MAYVLENEMCLVEVTDKAGEILHFVDKKKNEEMMYQGDQGWSGKNPTLFPIVGNTLSGSYMIDGKTYSMKNHGLIRYAILKYKELEDGIAFTLDSNEDTLAQYPFDFHYEIQYRLKGKTLHVDYIIQNLSNVDMPFSFGLHPAFITPKPFESCSIEFENEEHCEQFHFDAKGNKPIEYEALILKSLKLDREAFKKDATLIYRNLTSNYVTLDVQGTPRIKMSIKDFDLLAIWTHPTDSDFVCIEPWIGHADFEKGQDNFYARPYTRILKPSDAFTIGYTIEIC